MFGPHEHKERLVAHIITELQAGREATVKNGAVARDFLHTADVAAMMWEVFRHGHTGVFNIGTGTPTNLGDLGRIIAELVGRPEQLKVIVPTEPANTHVFANMDQINSILAWQPAFDLKSGLENTIEWWEKHQLNEGS